MVRNVRFINSKIVEIKETKKRTLHTICINLLPTLGVFFSIYEIVMIPLYLFTYSYLE